jgi:hypothetical protein
MTTSPNTPPRYQDCNGFGRNFQLAEADGAIWLLQTTAAANGTMRRYYKVTINMQIA